MEGQFQEPINVSEMIVMTHFFTISILDQASAIKVTHILRIFKVQSCQAVTW